MLPPSRAGVPTTWLPTRVMWRPSIPSILLESCKSALSVEPGVGGLIYQIRGENPKGLEEDFHKLIDTNVVGNIHFYNLFMPLILKGKVKKVICISSGMADLEMCNSLELDTGALYSISKAAMNLVTAKFNAQYKKDGVLFLGICPGMVDVGSFNPAERTDNPPFLSPFLPSLLSPLLEYSQINLTNSLIQWPHTSLRDCRNCLESLWSMRRISRARPLQSPLSELWSMFGRMLALKKEMEVHSCLI